MADELDIGHFVVPKSTTRHACFEPESWIDWLEI